MNTRPVLASASRPGRFFLALVLTTAAAGGAAFPAALAAQPSIPWHTIGGGGGLTAGGAFTLTATIGQPDAGTLSGGAFTLSGGFLTPLATVLPCYANCDGSTTLPILNVDDFTCFINQFAAARPLPHAQQISHYANCDGSTVAPVLNVDDFTCFINAFAQGCP